MKLGEELKQEVDMFKYIIGIDPYNKQEISKTNLERLRFPKLVEELAKYYEKVPLLEEPKQETTLEEAAENYGWRIKRNTFSDAVKANELAESAQQDFIEGAKWQAERMYSEEDIQLAWEDGRNGETERIGSYPFYKTVFKNKNFNKWFEQFKKK